MPDSRPSGLFDFAAIREELLTGGETAGLDDPHADRGGSSPWGQVLLGDGRTGEGVGDSARMVLAEFTEELVGCHQLHTCIGQCGRLEMLDVAGEQNIGNALIALDMANRMGLSPIVVMQNLHIIEGRPSFSELPMRQ